MKAAGVLLADPEGLRLLIIIVCWHGNRLFFFDIWHLVVILLPCYLAAGGYSFSV